MDAEKTAGYVISWLRASTSVSCLSFVTGRATLTHFSLLAASSGIGKPRRHLHMHTNTTNIITTTSVQRLTVDCFVEAAGKVHGPTSAHLSVGKLRGLA